MSDSVQTVTPDKSIGWGVSTSYYRNEFRDHEWRIVIDHASSMDEHRSYLLMRASSILLREEEKRLWLMTDAEVLKRIDELKASDPAR